MVRYTKNALVINHKVRMDGDIMKNRNIVTEKERNIEKFYNWYKKLNETEQEFYTRGFIDILAFRIGAIAIICFGICFGIGLVIGYII